MGGSVSVKPRSSKKSRAALMISARTRRIAAWRCDRTQRWRCSMRKSVPCSLGVIGIRRRLRDALHDLHVGHIELVAAVGALVGADFAFDDDARFLGQRLDGVEYFRRDRVFRNNALNDSRAVAKLREQKLSALAQVVEPAADGDRLAFVLADFCDGGDRGRHS